MPSRPKLAEASLSAKTSTAIQIDDANTLEVFASAQRITIVDTPPIHDLGAADGVHITITMDQARQLRDDLTKIIPDDSTLAGEGEKE